MSRAAHARRDPGRCRKRRGSKLAPFKPTLDRLLTKGAWNAVVILREYLGPKRALRPGRATVRFETRPGQQLQNDWGEVGTEIAGERASVHFTVNLRLKKGRIG